MKPSYLKEIQNIEKSIFQITSLNKEEKEFKKMGAYWIKSFKIQELNRVFNVSSIRLFPQRDFRAWSIWFFYWIKTFDFNKEKLVYLLGVLPSWFIMTKKKFKFHANFLYSRGRFTTLIYPEKENNFVLKIEMKTKKNILPKEVEALQIAGNVNHNQVKVPKFINKGEGENSKWFLQEMIYAKDIGNIAKYRRKEIYDMIFEFMIDFYFLHKVKTESIAKNRILQNPTIIDYIRSTKYGESILFKKDHLLSQNKKMLLATLHNDLYDKNILISKDKTIYIIDWGNTAENYLVHEFRNKRFDKEKVFNQIVSRLEVSTNDIYSLTQQVFLEDLMDTSKMIRKSLKRPKNKKFEMRINDRLKRLNSYHFQSEN